MAKNPNTVTPDTPHRADIEPARTDEPNVSAVLDHLWRRAEPTLTDADLAWLAGAGGEVSVSLNSLTRMLTGMACLAGELEDGTFPTLDPVKMSALLWPLINQLETLSSLAFVSGEAAHRLTNPSQYREGGPLHFR